MAIGTTRAGEVQYPGEAPTAPQPLRRRSDWLRPHAGWAIVGAVVGYLIGHWLGNVIASGYAHVQGSGQNDVATVLGLVLGVVGFLTGVGALNYPLAKMLGKEPPPEVPERSWVRYFKMTEDHKVVG